MRGRTVALLRALTDKGLPIGERLIRSRRNKPCDDECVQIGLRNA
jgi:hypothetical protein